MRRPLSVSFDRPIIIEGATVNETVYVMADISYNQWTNQNRAIYGELTLQVIKNTQKASNSHQQASLNNKNMSELSSDVNFKMWTWNKWRE